MMLPVLGGISGSNKTMLNMVAPQYGLIIGSWGVIGRKALTYLPNGEQVIHISY
jgi:hypothetical protein